MGEVLAGVALYRHPVEFSRAPVGFVRGSIRMCVSQMRIGQPHHEPGSRDIVHRRLLVRRHADADDDHGIVLEFDLGIGRTA